MGVKYFVDETFFDTWSSSMAYVLGYLYADGSLEDAPYLRGKYVRVSSTDESSIQLIRSLLRSQHSVVLSKRELPQKLQYLLRIGSHRLYDSLIERGLFPNKSLTMRLPNVPPEFFSHFARGYFDGDGCIFLEQSKGKTQDLIIRKLSAIFTSGSKEFLESFGEYLDKTLILERHKVLKGTRSFQLRYGTHDSIKLFSFLYTNADIGQYLQRKLNIFIKYFILRPSKIDTDMRVLLKRLSSLQEIKAL